VSMKVVILAGGHGTRLSEETRRIPKPMVRIGERPILWHIMTHYARFGFRDFVLALGYKGYVVKEYFANYRSHQSDFTVHLQDGGVSYSSRPAEDWRVTLVDTGLHTMTGGRLARLGGLLDEPFMLTYGDGLGNVDLTSLLQHHVDTGASATVTAVRPAPRFGSLDVQDGMVKAFMEKPLVAKDRINGGFFVMQPEVLDELDGDACVLEGAPLAKLAASGRLAAYEHDGFWMPMDTLRERDELEELWAGGNPPWTTP
jgi:glucose-1-phosphate cytidylyltransferase